MHRPEDGRREVLGVATGAWEGEPFWNKFPRFLVDRSMRGVKLSTAFLSHRSVAYCRIVLPAQDE